MAWATSDAVGQCRQLDQPDAVGKDPVRFAPHQSDAALNGKPGLADSSRPHKRHEPVRRDGLGDFTYFLVRPTKVVNGAGRLVLAAIARVVGGTSGDCWCSCQQGLFG